MEYTRVYNLVYSSSNNIEKDIFLYTPGCKVCKISRWSVGWLRRENKLTLKFIWVIIMLPFAHYLTLKRLTMEYAFRTHHSRPKQYHWIWVTSIKICCQCKMSYQSKNYSFSSIHFACKLCNIWCSKTGVFWCLLLQFYLAARCFYYRLEREYPLQSTW